MVKTKMFPFITKTWNPLGGECSYKCPHCWARKLIKKLDMKKYRGEPRLVNKELRKKFKKDDFVFVQDMTDLFGPDVDSYLIKRVLDFIKESKATFLLLTKNPRRYNDFELPKNCVCGVTVETDVGLARRDRLRNITKLDYPRKMISIEPIMYFTREFAPLLILSRVEFVAVGYDNYDNNLPEPLLDNTEELIYDLEKSGIKVYKKTLRECNQIVTY